MGTLPIIFSLGILFALEGLIARRIKKRKSERIAPLSGLHPPVSIVIPNYNGKELLKECLPSVVDSLSHVPGGSEIIVVDDGSSDESVNFLSEEFPQVKVIPLPVNQGFGAACNRGVAFAENRIVVLLNSDVLVHEDFLPGLTKHFMAAEVFAVQPKILAWDGKSLNGGINIPGEMYGYLAIENEADRQRLKYVDEAGPNLYAIGGAMAFDKVKWELLGGFDSLYSPFCWEDIDISYRALQRGWKVLYEPESRVVHKHHATLSKVFVPAFKRRIEQRNEMLFTWKNLYDARRLAKHFLLLPAHMLYRFFIRGDIGFALAFLKAAARVVPVLRRRTRGRTHAVVSDGGIMREVTDFYEQWFRKQKTKPRILVLTPFSPYPPADGGKLRVYTLLKLLSSKYDFHLLSFIWNGEQTDHRSGMENICRSADFVSIQDTSRSLFSRIKNLLYFPFRYAFHSTGEMKAKLDEYIDLYRPDIIQIEFTLMSVYSPYCRGIPTVFIEHDISAVSGNSYYRPLSGWRGILESLDRYRLLSWEKKICKMVNCVVAVTDEDREVLRGHFPGARVEVVSTGTDLEHFSAEYKEVENRNILFIGSMGHFPNVDASLYFLTAIFPEVKKEFPDATFTIVGSGKDEEVSSLAEGNPSVHITGYVEDVRPYIEKTEIFVAPMRRGAGIKGKILEAMAMSKPIVTTSIGAQGIYILPENDYLLADTPEQFIMQIARLFRSPDLKRKLAVDANEVCRKHYDWRLKAAQMEEIYRSLMGR